MLDISLLQKLTNCSCGTILHCLNENLLDCVEACVSTVKQNTGWTVEALQPPQLHLIVQYSVFVSLYDFKRE